MKMLLYSIGVFILLTVAGCNLDQTQNEQDKIAEELDPARNGQPPRDPEWDNRLGYVNYTKDQFEQDPEQSHMDLDRNQMADSIARIILQHEAFDEIATLVTDREVLIAYEKNDTLTEDEAADFAKKSASSITPRFFDIYVSDNPVLIPQIHSLHNSTTKESDYDNTLEQIISEMKQSSQGKE